MHNHLFVAVAGSALALSAPADASVAVCPSGPPTTITYSISTLDYDVSHVIHFNANPGCGAGRGGTLAFAGNSSTSFSLDYGEPQSLLFLMGTAQDLPGDPDGQKHIVIFGDTVWVAGANGIAWGTLFPSILEAQLIAALEDAATGQGAEASYQLIDNFWFDHAIPSGLNFGQDSDFSIIAFSTGQIIGRGSVSSTAAVIPEPATWAMLIAGFGLVGVAARRRRLAILQG